MNSSVFSFFPRRHWRLTVVALALIGATVAAQNHDSLVYDEPNGEEYPEEDVRLKGFISDLDTVRMSQGEPGLELPRTPSDSQTSDVPAVQAAAKAALGEPPPAAEPPAVAEKPATPAAAAPGPELTRREKPAFPPAVALKPSADENPVSGQKGTAAAAEKKVTEAQNGGSKTAKAASAPVKGKTASAGKTETKTTARASSRKSGKTLEELPVEKKSSETRRSTAEAKRSTSDGSRTRVEVSEARPSVSEEANRRTLQRGDLTVTRANGGQAAVRTGVSRRLTPASAVSGPGAVPAPQTRVITGPGGRLQVVVMGETRRRSQTCATVVAPPPPPMVMPGFGMPPVVGPGPVLLGPGFAPPPPGFW